MLALLRAVAGAQGAEGGFGEGGDAGKLADGHVGRFSDDGTGAVDCIWRVGGHGVEATALAAYALKDFRGMSFAVRGPGFARRELKPSQ